MSIPDSVEPVERPRIGYVLKVFPRLSQTFIVNELHAHEAAGADLTVFSLKRPRPSDAERPGPDLRARVVYLDAPESEWADRLAELVLEHRVDHLHAHFANVAARTAHAVSAKLGIPFSLTAHAVDIYADRVDQATLGRLIRDASAVITVSDYNTRHLAQRFGRASTRIYNGLPLECFPYVESDRSTDGILAVGRLVEKKGFGTLIEACRRLDAAGRSFSCQIAGEGPLRAALESAISEAGLGDRITLLGAVAPDRVRALLQEAAVLVAPCEVASDGDRDGLPTVLIEAMASGTPCIATPVTGIPELVRDGAAGLVVPPASPDDLAHAIRSLLDTPEYARQLAQQARLDVERDFDAARTSAQLRRAWSTTPTPRIVFRIHNRRGVGHWMRSHNIAREITRLDPRAEVVLFARSDPPFDAHSPRIQCLRARDPERLAIEELTELGLTPTLVVDDTILPEDILPEGTRHAFVLRRRSWKSSPGSDPRRRLMDLDCIVAPHLRHELDDLPEALLDRVHFVGPIARRATPEGDAAVRARYGLRADLPLLVSTPGGGGFADDFDRFGRIARALHLSPALREWQHVFICGPNAHTMVEPADERMIVVKTESEMPSLFARATAILSAAGYNSVNEILLARRPVFLIPGERKHDDQRRRAREIAALGVAWVEPPETNHPEETSSLIAACLAAPGRLADMAAAYRIVPEDAGNRKAAEHILRALGER
jgi:colanic acid/amylovoran biosynthesis glycosyltransferase